MKASMVYNWAFAVQIACCSGSAIAQDSPYGTSEYGGGWAVPSLDTSLEISREILNRSILDGFVRNNRTEDDGKGVEATAKPKASGGPAASATNASAQARTRFVRSKAVQKQSEASLLAELAKRQPGAVAEYRRVFSENDMVALFDQSAAEFGLKSDDVADTMAAYWLVSWVIANDAGDFTRPQAQAVREQLKAGMARTAVVGLQPEQKQRMADEAIFNTLIASAIYEFANTGKISKADYRKVGDATQKAFLGFGADLRGLRLTDAGFTKR